MKTLFLTHPVVMTRRQGNHSQRIELAEFTFEKRGADDPENDPALIRSCLSSFHDQDGEPVCEEELRGLKLEDGIKRCARTLFGDIPA